MLPKPKRLHKKRDFMKLAVKGRPVYGPYCVLRFREIKGPTQVAFITSTKVMKLAVTRNRAKRRMREVIAAMWNELPAGFHLLFVLKPECATVAYTSLQEETTGYLYG